MYVARVLIRLGGRKKYEPPRESAESLFERVTCVLSLRPPSSVAALRLCSCTLIQLELAIWRCRQSATMRAAPPATHRSASQRRAKHAECGGPNAMAATPAASVQRRAGSSACTARGRDRLGNYASIAHSPPLDQRRRQGRSTVMKSRRRGREECEPSRSIWSASARP